MKMPIEAPYDEVHLPAFVAKAPAPRVVDVLVDDERQRRCLHGRHEVRRDIDIRRISSRLIDSVKSILSSQSKSPHECATPWP